VRDTQDKFGQIDILINNAGIGGGGYIHTHDVHAWDKVMAAGIKSWRSTCGGHS
jgi:NADP-dependent 3-hydroxy acid dehydrogenase YdfG